MHSTSCSKNSLTLSVQYFNQILTVVLEVLDDSDSSTRELSLLLIVEMLKSQVCFIFAKASLSDL